MSVIVPLTFSSLLFSLILGNQPVSLSDISSIVEEKLIIQCQFPTVHIAARALLYSAYTNTNTNNLLPHPHHLLTILFDIV